MTGGEREPIDQVTLDRLWDFDDPAASERRFREAELAAESPNRRAELTTQRARALGLQGRYDEAAALLDAVDAAGSDDDAVAVRCLLERGRLYNSAGRPDDSLPLFDQAAERARRSGLDFLTIDALHMLAIAKPSEAAAYTGEALRLADASRDDRTKRWAVSLHNNLGWSLHDAERYDDALAEFEAAHDTSLRFGTPTQRHNAQWAIAHCLRSLGRYDQALAIQQQLARDDPPDPYVTEELDALCTAIASPRSAPEAP